MVTDYTKVQRQYVDLTSRLDSPSRSECERSYPDLIRFVRERISIVDLVEGSGLEIKQLSPDAPNCFVVMDGCPVCRGNLFLKRNSDA